MYFRFLLSVTLLFGLWSCAEAPAEEPVRGFYYWKSIYRQDSTSLRYLKELKVQRLYIKYFDVVWNEGDAAPQPVAQFRPADALPSGVEVVPVVFITNETLQRVEDGQAGTLAANLGKLLASIHTTYRLGTAREVQIDCDWTVRTRDRYFRLLQAMREQAFFQGKVLSATIRLHQLKYAGETGVPPVDRGLLMCYNMGDLRKPESRNSILDVAVLKQYTRGLGRYPLPLDAALPLFDWFVLFRGGAYKGLYHPFRLPGLARRSHQFATDTSLNGYTFEQGDRLRYEGSPAEEVEKAAAWLRLQQKAATGNVILYHLDSSLLNRYRLHELETVYRRFR